MFSAGGCQEIRKLESLLRVIKYPGYVDYNGLSKGDSSAFLPVLSFALTSFSPPFAEWLIAAGLELTGKTDLRFTDTLYKVLRDVFHYKPVLSKQQFLHSGFSQRKISFICDIINLVLQRHHQLKKVSKKTSVVDRKENHLTFPNSPLKQTSSRSVACTSGTEVNSSGCSGNEIKTPPEGEACKERLIYSSEVEGRLSALEAQQKSLLSELNKMNTLEKHQERLEAEKNDELFITVSRDSWENLRNRVFLLETKQELLNTQDDTKERLERISNIASRHRGDQPVELLRCNRRPGSFDSSLQVRNSVDQHQQRTWTQIITDCGNFTLDFKLKNSSSLLKKTELFTEDHHSAI